MDIFSWGIALDPSGIMIAGMFAGRITALDEMHLQLCENFVIERETGNIAFSGYSPSAYQKFDQRLPNGQGLARLYLHRGASREDLVEVGGIQFFYVWGASPAAPDFALWAGRMQDVHRIPLRAHWYPRLWEILLARGWVQPCQTFGFGTLWEVAVTSSEWQAVILENLAVLEGRSDAPAG
jgi:hypothetical protein